VSARLLANEPAIKALRQTIRKAIEVRKNLGYFPHMIRPYFGSWDRASAGISDIKNDLSLLVDYLDSDGDKCDPVAEHIRAKVLPQVREAGDSLRSYAEQYAEGDPHDMLMWARIETGCVRDALQDLLSLMPGGAQCS
jgi:hypothetical protein